MEAGGWPIPAERGSEGDAIPICGGKGCGWAKCAVGVGAGTGA